MGASGHKSHVHYLFARRLAALVVTTLIALSVGHMLFNAGLDQMSWGAAARDAPSHVVDIVKGEFGETTGVGCNASKRGQIGNIALCAGWGRGTVRGMMHKRVPVDVQLIIGGLVLGTFLGVAAGRWCAAYPGTVITRALHGAIAVLLSCPPYFLALVVLVWFSWSSGDYKIPFVSGQGDYRQFSDDPLGFIKAMWVPWVCCALPLAALVSRIAEASIDEVISEDFTRTARAKGLSERQVLNRHVLPVATAPVAAMTGVNVSTMLINAAAVEYAFGLPGMFLTIRGAIIAPDIPVLEALVLEGVILVVLANFVVDTYQAHLDPRIRARNDG